MDFNFLSKLSRNELMELSDVVDTMLGNFSEEDFFARARDIIDDILLLAQDYPDSSLTCRGVELLYNAPDNFQYSFND